MPMSLCALATASESTIHGWRSASLAESLCRAFTVIWELSKISTIHSFEAHTGKKIYPNWLPIFQFTNIVKKVRSEKPCLLVSWRGRQPRVISWTTPFLGSYRHLRWSVWWAAVPCCWDWTAVLRREECTRSHPETTCRTGRVTDSAVMSNNF